tara:strand:- start:69 stop:1376 length:1308 start_codon:yes stop_codon:yes gene_type:complete
MVKDLQYLWSSKFKKKKNAEKKHRSIEADEVHRIQKSKNRRFDKIQSKQKNFVWSVDLLDVRKWSDENGGCKACEWVDIQGKKGTTSKCNYIVVVVDIWSRYLWAYPTSTKAYNCVFPPLKKLIKEHSTKKYPIKNLNTDGEKSLMSNKAKEFYNREGITHWVAEFGDHARQGVVERLNRTIRQLLNKYFTIENVGNKWKNALPDIVETYNKSIHRMTKTTPHKAYHNIKKPFHPNPTVMPKYKIGDLVRKRIPLIQAKNYKESGLFKKRTEPVWSKTVYQIVGMKEIIKPYSTGKAGKMYEIKNATTGTKLKKGVRWNDLELVNAKNWKSSKNKLRTDDNEEEEYKSKKVAIKQVKKIRKVAKDLGIKNVKDILAPKRQTRFQKRKAEEAKKKEEEAKKKAEKAKKEKAKKAKKEAVKKQWVRRSTRKRNQKNK